jgi:hypothetical protein
LPTTTAHIGSENPKANALSKTPIFVAVGPDLSSFLPPQTNKQTNNVQTNFGERERERERERESERERE